MKLILLNHELSPIGGGAGHATRQIASELANRGHEITIVTAFADEPEVCHSRWGIDIQALLEPRRESRAPLTVNEHLAFHIAVRRRLQRISLDSAADGILAFFALPNGLGALPTIKKLGIPLGITLRGSDVPGFTNARLSRWQHRILYRPLKKTLSQSAFITANGHALRSLMARLWPQFASRISVVENGIHDCDIARGPASSGGQPLRLITVSRLIPRKRVDLILRALAECPDPRPELTVIGEGPESNKLKSLTEALRLTSRVTFRGQLDRPEINAALRVSDIFITASRAEGTSNSLLDAIGAGLPIITTRNGSDHTVTAMKCGYTVPIDDLNEIVRAIIKLHHPQLRATFARAGLNAIKESTWAVTAEAFESLFQQAAQVSNAGPPAPLSSDQDANSSIKHSGNHLPSNTSLKEAPHFSSTAPSVVAGEI